MEVLQMKLKPLGDRLIVRAIEEEQTTASGLVLPDTAKEKPQKGEVVAAGDGKLDDDGKRIPLDVKKGDEVLYSKYGGTEIKIAQKEIKYNSEARAALEAGVDAVANAVKVTLGPKGRYVVLDKKFGAPTITNDGVTIAREI